MLNKLHVYFLDQVFAAMVSEHTPESHVTGYWYFGIT
jgi:hypothetical protein